MLRGSYTSASRNCAPDPDGADERAHAASAAISTAAASARSVNSVRTAAKARNGHLVRFAVQRADGAPAAVQVVSPVHPRRARCAFEIMVEPLVEVDRPVLLVLAVPQPVLFAVER